MMKGKSAFRAAFLLCLLLALLLCGSAMAETCEHGKNEGDWCSDCGHSVCFHRDETMRETGFGIAAPYSYGQPNGDSHVVYGTMCYGTICSRCGELLEGEPVKGVTATYVKYEAHELDENGVCVKCGGTEYTCMHTNLRTREYCKVDWDSSGAFENFDNPTYHRVYGQEYQDILCNDCGLFMGSEQIGSEPCEKLLKHDASFGDSSCWACGYVFTCPHENVVRTAKQAGGQMYFAPKDADVHTYYGNWEWELYCTDCDLIVGYEDYLLTDEYGVDMAHEYDLEYDESISCIRCGYNCTHQNLKEIAREPGDGEGELVQGDADHHIYKGTVKITKECQACGKYFWETEQGEAEQEHTLTFDESLRKYVCPCGWTEKCTHNGEPEETECSTCGAWICYHRDETMRNTGFALEGPYTYGYYNGYTHMVYGTLVTGTACSNCGELLDSVPVEGVSATSFEWESHEPDENGNCIKCGGKVYECEHANVFTNQYYSANYDSEDYTPPENFGDPTYHRIRGQKYQDTICNDCGELLIERELIDEEYGERLVKHDASFGDPQCYCGYVFTCPHENVVRTPQEDGGYMYFAPKNDEVHTFYGNAYWKLHCLDCDLIVGYADSFITDANGFDQAHVYDDEDGYTGGVCIRCGYNCTHQNLKEISREKIEGELVQQDETHHIFKGSVKITYECQACMKQFWETQQVEVEEEHAFEYVRYEKCACACGLEGHDPSRIEACYGVSDTMIRYESLNLRMHSGFSRLTKYKQCTACGLCYDYQEVPVRTYVGEHNFEDGVCMECFAPQMDCSHENVVEYEYYCIDWEYTETDNPNYHVEVATLQASLQCKDCGEYMGMKDGTFIRETIEPHRQSSGKNSCQCGYVFTCSHENVTPQPVCGYDVSYYEQKDEKQHRYYGGYDQEYVCDDCGTIIYKNESLRYTDGNGIEEAHSMGNEGVCGYCGYSCPHENVKELSRKPGEGTAVYKDDICHTFTGLVYVAKECLDCHKTFAGAETDEFEEVHSFEYVEYEKCACACGLEGHDPDKQELIFRDGEIVSYQPLDLAHHYSFTRLMKGTYCMECGLEANLQETDAVVKYRREKHSFVDGVCKDCQAPEVVCDHSETYLDEYFIDSEFVKIDAKYHTEKVTLGAYIICKNCGEELGEIEEPIVREEKETHLAEVDYNPTSCYCGYEFVCKHENTTGYITESGGDMYWAQKNATHHQYYGSCQWDYVCDDCGTRIYKEGTWFTTDENGVELPHYVEEGCDYCLRCGYKFDTGSDEETDSIILNADRLYAVAGMNLPLEAKLSSGADASFGYVSYAPEVVQVNADGTLQAVSTGSTVIAVSAEGVDSVQCTVHVLPAIVLPDDTCLLESQAFAGSSIVAVDLSGNNGVRVEEGAFAACAQLKCVVLPENVEFADCVFDVKANVLLYCRNDAQVEYAQANGLQWMALP